MKVSGFSFIRNAIKYDYPIKEAILSVLPLCDEFIISVGDSDDDSLNLIQSISSNKIKIIHSVWDNSLKTGGKVLAEETNKALAKISPDSDWAFYIQGDEIVHEKYLDTIRNAMLKYKNHEKVDGLLFNYLHFYGSYDYIGSSSTWYPNEIRIIKPNRDIYSYRDAQGFRKNDNQKLFVKTIDAYIYHYGWVKPPQKMTDKLITFGTLYGEKIESQKKNHTSVFDYSSINELMRFEDTHPKVIIDRINSKNWKFEFDISKNNRSLKDYFKSFCKKYLGWNLYYSNYKILK